MTHDQGFIEKMKAQLESEKYELEKELREIATKDPNVKDDYDAKFTDFGDDEEADNPAEVAEYTDRIGVENVLEVKLREVNTALQRIENGTYGICEETGKEISKERLDAEPTARIAIPKTDPNL
ncbi:TraR/DksA family transcriptional regulator [Patescibacteria group bacterium]